MPITPDTKDWTWVLERTCPECRFDVRSFPREEIGEIIRTNAAEWRALLAHPEVSTRPSDDRWSALEYACHMCDVFVLYDERLRMMLETENPEYPNWDQDAAAIDGDYGTRAPDQLAIDIEVAAARLAARFDSVSGAQWERTGTRSDGARFTIESFGRYLVHDPIHHVHDVREGYRRLSGG